MRFLFPADAAAAAGDVDLETAYALPAPVPGKPHVRVSFVASVDGASEVGGRCGPLGSAADQEVLRTLRRLADVIVVGAGTIRAEGYGGIQNIQKNQKNQKRPRQQDAGTGTEGAPAPAIAIVSRRLDLDSSLPVFTKNAGRPLILTGSAAPIDRRRSLESVADVVVLGQDGVDPADMVAALAERGFMRILCEGGPTVYSAFASAAGLTDELCLNISPLLAGPGHSRIVSGHEWDGILPLTLVHVLEHAGMLFLKYRSGVQPEDKT